MAYAIYLRRSRADLEAEARGEGETLARHAGRLHDLARRRQLDVIAEYREIVSGSKLADRPQIRRVLDAYALAPSVAEQNALLKTIIDRIEYDKTHRCSRTENAADFLTPTLHPLLPKN